MSATLERDGRELGVDPRIAERRASVEGERRRRRRRRLLVVVVVVGLVVGAWLVTRSGLLDVERTEVTGSVHQSDDDVIAASGVRLGDQLVDIDEGSVARKVEALPWVDTAEVSVGLDGVVAIAVTERTPVATVAGAEGARFLVDVQGRNLGLVTIGTDTTGLVPLEGVDPGEPGSTLAGADGALAAISALGPGARSRVTAVVVGADGTLQLKLTPTIVVQLGPPTDLAAKAAALTTVLGQVEQRGVTGIDLRVPGDPVLTGNRG